MEAALDSGCDDSPQRLPAVLGGGVRTRRGHLQRSLVLGAGLLAACGRGPVPTPETGRKEKITLRHVPWPGIPAARAAQTAIVEAWNASHYDVQIQEETLPGTGSHYQKLLIQEAAGTLPDLAYMQGTWDYVSFAMKGLLAPIDELMKSDRQFDAAERIRPVFKDVVSMLGRTWGLRGRLAVTQNEESRQVYVEYCRSVGVPDWQVAWDAWEIGYGRPLTPAWPDIEREAVNPAFSKLFGPEGAGASVDGTLRAIAPVVQRHLDQLGQPPAGTR